MTEVPTKVQTSLPPKDQKSEQRVVSFFDNYFTKPIEVSANDYDAVIGFFSKIFGPKRKRSESQLCGIQRHSREQDHRT